MLCYLTIKYNNFFRQKSDQVDAEYQLSSLLIYNTMSSQKFTVLPQKSFVEKQSKSSEALFDPTVTGKFEQLKMLRRQKLTVGSDEKSTAF